MKLRTEQTPPPRTNFEPPYIAPPVPVTLGYASSPPPLPPAYLNGTPTAPESNAPTVHVGKQRYYTKGLRTKGRLVISGFVASPIRIGNLTFPKGSWVHRSSAGEVDRIVTPRDAQIGQLRVQARTLFNFKNGVAVGLFSRFLMDHRDVLYTAETGLELHPNTTLVMRGKLLTQMQFGQTVLPVGSVVEYDREGHITKCELSEDTVVGTIPLRAHASIYYVNEYDLDIFGDPLMLLSTVRSFRDPYTSQAVRTFAPVLFYLNGQLASGTLSESWTDGINSLQSQAQIRFDEHGNYIPY